MEDVEIDLSEDVLEPETDSEDSSPARKPFWVLPFIGLFFLIFALFLVLGNNGPKGRNQNAGPSDALVEFQNVSNEMHTGVRLARLDDFLAQYANSSYAYVAQARRNALKRHEEKAWARLTETFYDAEADEIARSLAIVAYTDIWTPLHRPEQLKTLEQTLPNDAVPNFRPNERKSRFASGGNDQFLEGAPISRGSFLQRAFTRGSEPQRIDPSRIVEPQIRTKRKPSYPSKARRRRIEADVVLELDIDDRGRVSQVRLKSVRADRYAEDFVKAAKRAARRTRFYPKTIGGRPIATSGYVQKYAFRTSR